MADFQYGILPYYADDFLVYLEAISGKSKNTINEYYYDLLMFFRFMKTKKNPSLRIEEFQNICVNDFSVQELSEIRLSDLYSFLNYMNNDRKDQAPTRARKVACLRSFFKYVWNKANLIPENPAAELESPKITKKLPKYLELNESIALLDSIDGDFKERDFCIITLFLNCGMRLSELVGINISDIREDTLTVIGKGDKERTVYLNKACVEAIKNYLEIRPYGDDVLDKKALFLSERKQRISKRTVQHIIKEYLKQIGGAENLSTHKLRHTAATLMYQYGNVDIRALQEILGHESIATTEIYTHVDSSQIREAIENNPLANYNADK